MKTPDRQNSVIACSKSRFFPSFQQRNCLLSILFAVRISTFYFQRNRNILRVEKMPTNQQKTKPLRDIFITNNVIKIIQRSLTLFAYFFVTAGRKRQSVKE